MGVFVHINPATVSTIENLSHLSNPLALFYVSDVDKHRTYDRTGRHVHEQLQRWRCGAQELQWPDQLGLCGPL
jgi:hypothetical protein